MSYPYVYLLLARKKVRKLMERHLDVGYLKVKEFKLSEVKLSVIEFIKAEDRESSCVSSNGYNVNVRVFRLVLLGVEPVLYC
jgi:hypothetical protein